MNIRPICEQDLQDCSKLFFEVFTHPPYDEPWNLEKATRRLAHFFRCDSFVGFVAEDAGTKMYGFILGVSEPWLDHSTITINEFCVAPTKQNKGVGSSLLKTMETHAAAAKAASIVISTYPHVPAFNYYKKRGYMVSENVVFLVKKLASTTEVGSQ